MLLMNGNDSHDKLFDLLDMVLWYIGERYCDSHFIGELIGQTISISSMDRAIRMEYQTPILVNDYYQALLTDEGCETVRSSLPVNAVNLTEKDADVTFEEAFKDGYFHFSHYSQSSDMCLLIKGISWGIWI